MKFLNTICIFFLFTSLLSAQKNLKSISDFKATTKARVAINPISNVPEFITFSANKALVTKGETIKQKALNFLNTNKALYNINDVNTSFSSLITEQDDYGFYKLELQQKHQNVPVYDGKLLFHFNNDKALTAINGNYIPNIKLNAIPTLNKSEANSYAILQLENQNINFSGSPLYVNNSELYVFNKGLARGINSANFLVYEVEVRNDLDVREFLFINAHTGALVEQYTGIADALDRTVYEGNTGTAVWEEGDVFPATLTNWQQNEVVASGHTYYFFKNAFNYESYDGADAQMLTINNSPDITCPNATWNGVTANFCDGTASDDVIAHEWGHAYTGGTNNLIYQWQSGAINESYSDIWGETIDLLNNYEDLDEDNSIRISDTCGTSNRWLVGEDASAFSSSLRDMWNPTCKGDPGKVSDTEYLCGEADFGGVHINSGIPNHAYALFVDGGTYNGFTIAGVGFTKAAHVFWRAQSQYLTATSDFNTLANALEASANDLLGINLQGLSTTAIPAGVLGEIITKNDIAQLKKAILAVELRLYPDFCGYERILTTTPDLCEAASTSPVYIEDWETGMDGWTLDQVIPSSSTWEPRDWEIKTSLPNRSGSGIYAVNAPIGDLYGGDCSSNFQNGILRLESPVITLPNLDDGTYELAFNHYVATEESWDGGNLKISINGGDYSILPVSAFTANPYNGTINTQAAGNDNPMEGEFAFTGLDEGANQGSWGTSIINLTSLGLEANSTFQIRFEFGTDGCNGIEGWYLDEFVVYNCSLLSLDTRIFNTVTNTFKIYPNPSNSIFNLKKMAGVNLDKAEIHDINGRFIKAINLSNMSETISINLSEVASGLYFMTVIQDNNAASVVKLLKK